MSHNPAFVFQAFATLETLSTIGFRCSCCGCCLCSICCFTFCNVELVNQIAELYQSASSSQSSNCCATNCAAATTPDVIENDNESSSSAIDDATKSTCLLSGAGNCKVVESADSVDSSSSISSIFLSRIVASQKGSSGGSHSHSHSHHHHRLPSNPPHEKSKSTSRAATSWRIDIEDCTAASVSDPQTQKLLDAVSKIVKSGSCLLCARCEYFFWTPRKVVLAKSLGKSSSSSGGSSSSSSICASNTNPVIKDDASDHYTAASIAASLGPLRHPSLLGACVLCNRCDGCLVQRIGNPLSGTSASTAGKAAAASTESHLTESSIGNRGGNSNALERYDQSAGIHWVHPCCADWFVTAKLKGNGPYYVGKIFRKYGARPGGSEDHTVAQTSVGHSRPSETSLVCVFCGLSVGAIWTCNHLKCNHG